MAQDQLKPWCLTVSFLGFVTADGFGALTDLLNFVMSLLSMAQPDS